MEFTDEGPVQCIRCGLCCIAGCCWAGEEDEFGICKFLLVNQDLTTTCTKIRDDTVVRGSLIGTGCFVRRSQTIVDGYLEVYDIDTIKTEILKKQGGDVVE